MKLRRKIRPVFEVLFVALGFIILPPAPRVVITWLAKLLGTLGYHIAGKPRRIANANVQLAFGDSLTADEKEAIVRSSFKSFTLLVLDLFWFSWFTERRIGKHVRFDYACEKFFETCPAIALTAHIGNWEMSGHVIALRKQPFTAVAASLDNPVVDWLLHRLRRSSGQQITLKQGAMRAALQVLNDGGRIGLLLDQNVLPKDGGKFVEFFGLPVPMSGAVEKLAMKTHVPVTFIFCIPQEDGSYLCRSVPQITPDHEDDSSDITQEIAHALEAEIRTNPHHWLWMYKRWTYVPPYEDREKYPF